MPNHLHALISFCSTGKNINTIIGNGKRFMAYDIVERLQQTNNEIVLAKLSNAVKQSDKKRGKLHEVFEDSFYNKDALQKNSFYKNSITFIGIHAVENGILQHAREIICIALQVSIIKEYREFLRWIILCK